MRCGELAWHETGDRLLRQGDLDGSVLLSLAGRVKVAYSEPDGAEIVLAIRGPGDLIGELSARDGLPRSATVQAIEPGRTARMSEQSFADAVRRLGLEAQLESYVSRKLRESALHAWRLAHRATASRLAALIVTIIDAAGPDHVAPTTVEMSQEELASALGLVRSAITPVLKDWKSAGLVQVSRGKLVIVSVPALIDVSNAGQNHPRL